MTDFESSHVLLQQLAVHDCPRKHWSTYCRWEIADNMALVLSDHTKKIIAKACFFSILTIEITTIDHESWLSIYIYVVIRFKRVNILLALQPLVEGDGANALKDAIVTNLTHHGRLLGNHIVEKLVCFGKECMPVFHGSRFGATTQLKE